MNYQNILLTKGAVATLTLNNPDTRNALSTPMQADILAGLRELELDTDVKVIIIRGAGRGFCAGLNIGNFLGKKVLEARAYFGGVAQIAETIAKLSKPVIAQVHGFALAGGCGLAVACDFTYAAEDALFALTEINLGLWPHISSLATFRSMGRKKGFEFIFTGDRITGREAEEHGLITRALPSDDLDGFVQELAGKLAAKSSAALKIGKESLYTMMDMEYFQALRYLRDMLTMQSMTDDGQEGPLSFIEKREPQWRGE